MDESGMNFEVYVKALEWLENNYSMACKIFDDDSDIAMFFYQQCDPVIDFLWKTGIVGFAEYSALRDRHNDLFNDIFFS